MTTHKCALIQMAPKGDTEMAPDAIGGAMLAAHIPLIDQAGEAGVQASADSDELLIHEIDLDMVREIRNNWQFFRDRRPELYDTLIEL